MKRFTKVFYLACIVVAANSANAGEKELNMRGVMCDSIDFNELNTYSQEELEALYCSYDKGHKIADKTMTAAADKHKGTRTEVAILQDGIRAMERCSRPMMRVGELLKRKFSGTKHIRCEDYKGYTPQDPN